MRDGSGALRGDDPGLAINTAHLGEEMFMPAHVVSRRHGGYRLLLFMDRARSREDLDDLEASFLEIDAQFLEDPGRDPLTFPDEAQQEMLGADIVMTETASLIYCQLDHLFGSGCQSDLASYLSLARANDELDRAANFGQLDSQVREDFGGDSLTLSDQAKQEMFGADVVVVEALGLLLSQGEDLASALGKSVEIAVHA